MVIKFRKSVKITNGVRLNFGKKGISTSIDKHGAGITFGQTGTIMHMSIPSTNLSFVKKVSTDKGKIVSSSNHKKSNGNRCYSCSAWFVILFFLGILIGIHDKYGWTPFIIGTFIITALIVLNYLYLTSSSKKFKELIEDKKENSKNAIQYTQQKNISSQEESTTTNDLAKDEDIKQLHNTNEKILETPDPLLEAVAESIVLNQQSSQSFIQRKFSIGFYRSRRILDQLECIGIIGPVIGSKSREILVHTKDALYEILLNKRASFNQDLSSENQSFENNYMGNQNNDKGHSKSNNSNNNITSNINNNIIIHNANSQDELKSLIGLTSVKDEITSLSNFIKLNQKRMEQGLPTTRISYHCVFTGNPGTGKTTVARLLASIFKELGVIKKGQLVETDRSGLVAEYVGQTAVKTNKIIDSALDGVLFIDEAYTLSKSGNQDFGYEAIATLLKRMEDNRDRLIVILAGYEKEMKSFIDSNPGLRSRFNRYINFPDYSSEELMDIFELYLKKKQYVLSADAAEYVKSFMSNIISDKQKDFGNARFVRNLFEKTIEQQANRLVEVTEYDKETLKLIEKEDILKSIEHMQ